MTPFLYQVASLFYQQYGAEVSKLAFVFPNRRTGLFFQKYLSEVADKPLFSPTILTINDLFVQLSGKQAADKINMLFMLYDIYIRHSGSTETFDEFLYWGEMLLNDFDDVDKYMADARMLFTNVTDLREIENDFSFLDEDQIAATVHSGRLSIRREILRTRKNFWLSGKSCIRCTPICVKHWRRREEAMKV